MEYRLLTNEEKREGLYLTAELNALVNKISTYPFGHPERIKLEFEYQCIADKVSAIGRIAA